MGYGCLISSFPDSEADLHMRTSSFTALENYSQSIDQKKRTKALKLALILSSGLASPIGQRICFCGMVLFFQPALLVFTGQKCRFLAFKSQIPLPQKAYWF